MRVIFKKSVAHVARVGEVKEVAEGYARNFLLPHGLAIPATTLTLQREREQTRRQERAHGEQARSLQQALQHLQGQHITFQAPANEHGTLFAGVTAARISDILKRGGYAVSVDALQVSGPLKQLGEYTIQAQQGGYQVTFTLVIQKA